jgi:hypothetical protein
MHRGLKEEFGWPVNNENAHRQSCNFSFNSGWPKSLSNFPFSPCNLISLSTLQNIGRRGSTCCFPRWLVDFQESLVYKPVGLSIIHRCGTIDISTIHDMSSNYWLYFPLTRSRKILTHETNFISETWLVARGPACTSPRTELYMYGASDDSSERTDFRLTGGIVRKLVCNIRLILKRTKNKGRNLTSFISR